MAKKMTSEKQRQIFAILSKYPILIFAGGRPGYSANIVGPFHINSMPGEDRLDMGDGTNHIHIDWDVVAGYRVDSFHGEGMIEFRDKESEPLFKLYNPAGAFADDALSNGREEKLW